MDTAPELSLQSVEKTPPRPVYHLRAKAEKYIRPIDKPNKLYVLRCLQDETQAGTDYERYYVGITDRQPLKRMKEHLKGTGSKWTYYHQPRARVEMTEEAYDGHETDITLEYMARYGIDRVRGGKYCSVILSNKTRKEIESRLEPIRTRNNENKDREWNVADNHYFRMRVKNQRNAGCLSQKKERKHIVSTLSTLIREIVFEQQMLL